MPEAEPRPRPGPHPARRGLGLGRLGRRLVVAFSLVSLVTVGLLALAAQRAVDRGITVAAAGGRVGVAEDLAAVASRAYDDAGGWAGADLTAVEAAAADLGVLVMVRDAAGDVLTAAGDAGASTPAPTTTTAATADDAGQAAGQGAGQRVGQGVGHSGGGGAGNRAGQGLGGLASVPVVVDGVAVGTVTVTVRPGAEGRAQAQGRDLAWSWIAAAAVMSLVFAVVAGWLVTRRITGPLAGLAATARAFARGGRDVRADEAAPGEIGEVARGINEAIEAVEVGARARRQMAADVAHELRTPLAALQAGLEELRDGLVPADPEALGRLHGQAVRLGRVVGDLGVLAAVDDAPRGVAPGRADLARLVADAVEARRAELRAAGVEVRRTDLVPVAVAADPDRMHQVVGNLLANVARHCRPGDAVDVHLTREGSQAVLRVVDNGPGIPAEDLPRVFDRYWRGAHEGVVGSGLGLAVVREIVAAHGGTVEIESPGGGSGGTTVVVRLPALAGHVRGGAT